ncbi:MAG TPA: c-type cytochrome, partial [bacterium]|nr:c-type cytochrome [bacterium]
MGARCVANCTTRSTLSPPTLVSRRTDRMRTRSFVAFVLCSAAVAQSAPQASLQQGAKVTFEQLRGGKARHSQRARLLSLAVERGETPTPFLPPGAFRATFEAVVTLPARDRMNFRVDGVGKVRLSIDGKVVLDGRVRAGKPLVTAKAVRLRKGGNDLKLEFESAARGDGRVRLFWSGYDFGFEPIAPERLSFVAGDEQVARGERLRLGHRLFVERRCARCHDYGDNRRITESAFLELDRAGPDLRRVGARSHAGWLFEWLRDPRAVRPESTMPAFSLSDDEAGDIATWLATLGEPLPAVPFTRRQV